MTEIHALNRTLDQELLALMRGASLECLVCGEFVLHAGGMITCPECASCLRARPGSEQTQLQFDSQAG
jgi:hypothetical protein